MEMIRSGIAPLDTRLGGLVPRRSYVLTGAPGTGKTAACLEFLNEGCTAGEPAVILTQDDPTDLICQGQFLGIDLEKDLAEERLVLLRYQLDFARRFARVASPETAFDELRSLLGSVRPTRCVIDSVAPFLDSGTAAGVGILSLVAFLDSLAATSLVTYPADLAGLYDRRLEPLAQRAAAILHLSCGEAGVHRMELRKVRFAVPSTAAIAFAIESGTGIVGIAEQHRRRAGDADPNAADKLLVIDSTQAFSRELLAALRTTYQVTLRHTVSSAFAELAAASGAVLIDVRRDTVDDAVTLVRELRRAGNHAPIVLVTAFTLRADDRARALSAGADEFLAGDLHPAEFLVRMQRIVARGHVACGLPEAEPARVTQPRMDGVRFDLLDGHAFRNAVHSRMASRPPAFFTVVTLRPEDPATGLRLAEFALSALRLKGGDLAGFFDGMVAILLHAARRRDVTPFLERVREEWLRADGGEIAVAMAAHPSEEESVADLFSGPALAPELPGLRPNERGTLLEPAEPHAPLDDRAPVITTDLLEADVARNAEHPAPGLELEHGV